MKMAFFILNFSSKINQKSINIPSKMIILSLFFKNTGLKTGKKGLCFKTCQPKRYKISRLNKKC